MIARVWNLSDAPTPYPPALADGIPVAEQVTHVETRRGPASLAGGVVSATTLPPSQTRQQRRPS